MLVAAFAMARGTLCAAKFLHNNLLEKMMRFPMSFFDTTPMGRIVNRFSKDVDTVDCDIPRTLRLKLMILRLQVKLNCFYRELIVCVLQVVATLIVISVQIPMFLIVVLPVALMYYFIQVRINETIFKNYFYSFKIFDIILEILCANISTAQASRVCYSIPHLFSLQ